MQASSNIGSLRAASFLRTLCVFACAMVAMSGAGCDHGLDPIRDVSVQPGLSGRVTVRSAFPPPDSLKDLRIVLFRNYPPIGILEEFLAGALRFSDPLPMDAASFEWQIRADDLNGVYPYVVVAWQFGPDPFSNWRVAGVYAPSGDPTRPQAVDLGGGRFLQGIDIAVDFVNLPPQPF